jgi:hypothetical protein
MHGRSLLKGLGFSTGLALTGNAFESKGLSPNPIFQAAALADAVPASTAVRLIETPEATLRISEQTGDLVGLYWENPNLEVMLEPRLGENFRLLIPKTGYEAAYFNSRDQSVSRIEDASDGVLCTYESLQRTGSSENDPETIPVQVRYRIRIANGQVLFSIEVTNPTDRKLAEVMYGIVGGLQGIGNRLDTESFVPGANVNVAPGLFSRFHGGGYGGGNLGIRYDAAGFSYPGNMSTGWLDVFNRKADMGYYYANQDPETRLTLLYFEMRHFAKGASMKDSWPSPSEVSGEPLGITMGWVNFPYLIQGTFTAGPVALRVHKGGERAASAIYRTWFDKHFPIKRPRSWLRQENAWQSIILSDSEDVVVHRFDELPKLAADAKKYDITTFEILGWDIGGIDRGYPQYQPDPRMGTPAEFHKALADMRKLGVHPLIFSNVQVADTATPVFRDTLKQYTLFLLKKNHSVGLFRKSFAREFMLAFAGALLWLFGMLGYGVGAGKMEKYGNSIGFAVFMAVMLLWSTSLGLITGEWKSAPSVAQGRMRMGLALIIVSMSVLGIGTLVHE